MPSDLRPDPITGKSKFSSEFSSSKVTKTVRSEGVSFSYEFTLITPQADLTLCAGQVYEGFLFQLEKSQLTFDCSGATIKGLSHASLNLGQKRLVRSEGIVIQSTWKTPLSNVTVKNCVIDKPNAVGVQVLSQPEYEKVEVEVGGSKVTYRGKEYPLSTATWGDTPVNFISVPYKLQVFTRVSPGQKPYVMDPWVTRLQSAGSLNEDGTETPTTRSVKQMFRDRGPKKILIENVTVNDALGNAMNLNVGVTGVTIRRARLKNPHMGLYLSTGSFENRIENSEFITEPEVGTREFLAIDSSAGNIIVNNLFKGNRTDGGIYLYKNCWEYHDQEGASGGLPRNQDSHGNLIALNRFENLTTAIWVASRQSEDQLRAQCGDTSPYNKSRLFYSYKADDERRYFIDFASHNKIENNHFEGTDLAIKVEDDFTSIINNRFIYEGENQRPVIQIGTPLRSFIGNPVRETAIERNFLTGKRADFAKFVEIAFASRNVHFSQNETGVLLPDGKPDLSKSKSVRNAHFVYKAATASNTGLQFRFACPSGEKIVGVRAICDLETGVLKMDQMRYLNSELPSDSIEVLTTSTVITRGRCSAGSTSISSGRAGVPRSDSSSIEFTCQEHDANGGDCAIAASIICEKAEN